MNALANKTASRRRVYLSEWEIENFRKLIAEAQDAATGDGKHARVITDKGYAYQWIGAAAAHFDMLLKQVRG